MSTTFCPHCNQITLDSDEFCGNCGHLLKEQLSDMKHTPTDSHAGPPDEASEQLINEKRELKPTRSRRNRWIIALTVALASLLTAGGFFASLVLPS